MQILIADDNIEWCDTLSKLLEGEGWRTLTATAPQRVLEILQHDGDRIDVVLLDLDFHHPEIDGLDILRQIRRHYPALPVVMLTGVGTIPDAVEAMRLGAVDFLSKDQVTADKIRKVVYTIAQTVKAEDEHLLDQLQQYGVIGRSVAMQRVARAVHLFAKTDLNILITGETGTGKGQLARAIHQLSRRRQQEFVHIDIPNIPNDLFESELFGHLKGAFTGADQKKIGLFAQADGGTIFLDEIGDLNAQRQASLLIPVEEKRIRPVGSTKWQELDVRFIAATDRDLEAAVQRGEFRPQLYYRLKEAHIHLPPLRERREDIRLIVEFYTHQHNRKWKEEKYFEPAAVELLEQQEWRGNIRELKQFVNRILQIIDRSRITLQDVAEALWQEGKGSVVAEVQSVGGQTARGGSWREEVEELKKERIIQELRNYRGNVSKTANALGISRETLYKYIRKYGIEVDQFRRS